MNDNNHGDILKRRKNKQEQHIKNVFARIFFNVWILKLWDFDVWLYVCFLCLASFKLHDNIILSNTNAQTNIQTQIHWIRCQSNERKKQNWVNICSNTDLQWSADVKYWALLKLIKMMEHRLRLMCVCVHACEMKLNIHSQECSAWVSLNTLTKKWKWRRKVNDQNYIC